MHGEESLVPVFSTTMADLNPKSMVVQKTIPRKVEKGTQPVNMNSFSENRYQDAFLVRAIGI